MPLASLLIFFNSEQSLPIFKHVGCILAKPSCLRYACMQREWMSPGGLPGLQSRWRVALRAAMGSTPMHSRLNLNAEDLTTINPMTPPLNPIELLQPTQNLDKILSA